jgi:cytochrome b561
VKAVASTDGHGNPFNNRRDPMNTLPSRYHPVLVGLHWLLAALILLALAMGTFVLAEIPNTSADKIGALRGHMIIGLVIGALMLVRLLVRLRTQRPAAALTGNKALDQLGKIAHAGLYLLVFAMAASGLGTALLAGLPQIVLEGGTAGLPDSFFIYAPRVVHGWVAKGLMALIALHLVGVVFHQFGLKDRLLSRMGFGKR